VLKDVDLTSDALLDLQGWTKFNNEMPAATHLDSSFSETIEFLTQGGNIRRGYLHLKESIKERCGDICLLNEVSWTNHHSFNEFQGWRRIKE
jgi:hypothetical protein